VRSIKDRLKGDLDVLAAFDITAARDLYDFDYAKWTDPEGIKVRLESELLKDRKLTLSQRMRITVDRHIDAIIGYYPMTMRFNMKHGFMRDRMTWGNANPYLNLKLGWPFSGSEVIYRMMNSWYYGKQRYFHPAITEYMSKNTSCLLTANLQFKSTQPYIITADRLNIPIYANIASWDHPVGKGIVFKGCVRYVVQNTYMKEALQQYHNIPGNRIIITGWPQTDLFARKTSEFDYKSLLASYGLDPDRPCILIAGNSPANAPYEPEFIRKFLETWRKTDKNRDYSVVFRPHPKDSTWRKRYTGIANDGYLYVQPASFSDIDVLSMLLQHVNCVVSNAGTILLDSLVNARPVVCVLYDEGAPSGSGYAVKNITGHHYQDLMSSGAFYKANSMAEVFSSIDRGLSNPNELDGHRNAICQRIIGNVDGKAGERIAEAMMPSSDEGLGCEATTGGQ